MADLKAKKLGRAITPEMAAALAVEAEAGYDLSLAQRRRMGWPSLDEGCHRASASARQRSYTKRRESRPPRRAAP